MFLSLSVCLSAGYLIKLSTNFHYFFGGMECAKSLRGMAANINKRLDFDDDRDHDEDQEFLNRVLTIAEQEQSFEFCR